MGAWITLGALFLLALLPLGIWFHYDSGGPRVKVVCGPLKFTVFPRPKKEKKETREKKEKRKPVPKQEAEEGPGTESAQRDQPVRKEKPLPQPPQPPQPEKPKQEKKETGGSVQDFLPLVKVALDFLGDFRRKLRLDELYLRLILASGDPCDLAVNYGKTWAAVGNLLPALERWFVIKKRDVEVECDFTASETLVIARIQITITLGRLLSLIAVYAVRALKEFMNIRNKRKGGAEK